MSTMNFTNRSKAVKQTKISYIGGVNTSAKIIKNAKVSKVNTYCIYLAPANLSGYNTCSHSTPECRRGCLNTSGRAGMEVIIGKKMTSNCRANKTRLFYENNEFFMQWVIAEITAKQALSAKKDMDFAVRLNGTSDIDWANVKYNGKNLFETFPNIQFYDYTKNPNKFNDIAPNYHLTMSYTGHNWNACDELLNKGFNTAVVFDVKRGKALPTEFNGYKVVDGDLTDFRPLDGNGVIVGLRWKVIGDKQVNDEVRNSCFVVKPYNINGFITYDTIQEIKVPETIAA